MQATNSQLVLDAIGGMLEYIGTAVADFFKNTFVPFVVGLVKIIVAVAEFVIDAINTYVGRAPPTTCAVVLTTMAV